MRSAVAASLLLLLASCEARPRTLQWEVRFVPSSLTDRVAVLVAEIHVGSCDVPGSLRYRETISIEGTGPVPGELSPGRYAFLVQALDADCVVFAEGCGEIVLPTSDEGSVSVALNPTEEIAACEPGACQMGRCAGTPADGGAVDAPVDAFVAELCDGVDNDGDMAVDELGAIDGTIVYRDADGDTYGDPTMESRACGTEDGWVETADDCDDSDNEVFTGAEETCNATDDDCDSMIDEDDVCSCNRRTFRGHTYQLCRFTRDWASARTQCLGVGYDLVIIDDDEENDYLWTEARAVNSTDWWIGLEDMMLNGRYVWVDGRVVWDAGAALGYTTWLNGTPLDNPDESCIRLDGNTGMWSDSQCFRSRPFICETGP